MPENSAVVRTRITKTVRLLELLSATLHRLVDKNVMIMCSIRII